MTVTQGNIVTNKDLSVSVGTTTRQADTGVAAGDTGPARFDDETEARLDRLDREATAHVEEHRPEKTRDSYAADWKAWTRFTAASGLPLLAVRSGTLVLFVEWCWLQPGRSPGRLTAPSTILDPDSFAFRAVHNRWKTVLDSGIEPITGCR